MRTFDLNQLFPYSVGFDRFDRLFDLAERSAARDVSYPPYNIARLGENEYRVTMAVAGFAEKDLEIEVKENALTVRGRIEEPNEGVTYLHRGIGARAFERTFQLADFMKVQGAQLVNGLLEIDLAREVPESAKPRKIEIAHGTEPRTIEGAGHQQAA